MFLDNKDEFQTVWQLAHNWVGANPEETDINAISPELKNTIHSLLLAITNKRISGRTRRWIILEDDSIFTSPLDFYHRLRFYPCLKQNKFSKTYLDNIYVKRDEVINWCVNFALIDPPPCWLPKKLSGKQFLGDERKHHDSAGETVSIESDVSSGNVSSQQRAAALKGHEPRAKLKQERIKYWLHHQNYSNNHAASKFYAELPADKKKLLKETNAERTLAKAISDYRNRKKLIEEGRLPNWLINFNPENQPE